MISTIQQIILFLGTLVGGITDTKTGYIYDWITIPMIILGLILNILQIQLFNLVSGGIIFLTLLIGYKLGKIGGGDVKIFTSIALLNPFNKIDFLITLFFFATISSMVFYSIYYLIKYYKKGIIFEREKKGIYNAIILGTILFFYLIIMNNLRMAQLHTILILSIPIITGLIYFALQKGIKEEFFEKKILIKNLEEDEIVGEKNNKIIKKLLNGKVLLGKKEIAYLKKQKIKSIFVLRNLPKFGPFIFIGTIIAIIWPELFLIFFV
ncbi:MAG: A24 family peptidase [Candidatus ainarchaeum sp.]|nr:A24 family peptidase [Candidatus ainarchaeum sp.]